MDIGIKGIQRTLKARAGVTLCGEVENVIRFRLPDDVLHGQRIAQIAIEYADPFALVDHRHEVPEVLKWAAPTAHADNVPIGLGDQIIGEMGADHASDTCDQGARLRHAERTPLLARNISIAPRIWSRAALSIS